MRRVCIALGLAALVPMSARADPIMVDLHSATNATQSGSPTVGWTSIDLGAIAVSGGESSMTFSLSELRRRAPYTVALDLSSLTGLESVQFEVLDPLDRDDRADPSAMPAYVPGGYSTSNDLDGFSFAQGAGLERSARFAGGSVAAVADEMTHRGDILLFSGLQGAEEARVQFGLWDWRGGGHFLLRMTVTSLETSASPEPASMLLLGTGLAGLAGAYRRRRTLARRG